MSKIERWPEDWEIDHIVHTFTPGLRVRHIGGRWTGVVVERPANANPGVHESSIWILPDGPEMRPESWAPKALLGKVEPYSGPVCTRAQLREDEERHLKGLGLL